MSCLLYLIFGFLVSLRSLNFWILLPNSERVAFVEVCVEECGVDAREGCFVELAHAVGC